MFGVDMECEQREILSETIPGLKKRFKKLVAVNIINAEGLPDGTFQFIFDHEGLFTLGGIIVMLPEERILSNRQNASAKLAEGMVDAMGEAGNLLVASWNKIFSRETMGLAGDEEVFFIPYEMTVGSYPAFKCGVIFPKKIFAGGSDFAPEEANIIEENTQEITEENPQNTQTDPKKPKAKNLNQTSQLLKRHPLRQLALKKLQRKLKPGKPKRIKAIQNRLPRLRKVKPKKHRSGSARHRINRKKPLRMKKLIMVLLKVK